MRTFLLAQCLLLSLLAAGQVANDRVLLVEHNNYKRQFFFAEGNQITFFTKKGEKATGILAEVTDSTVTVGSKGYKLEDIIRIKRRTAGTFAKVIGGIFVFDGVILLASAAAEPEYAGPIVFIGLTSIAVGLPLMIEPSFKVGVNCRLRVATNSGYVKRR